MYQFYGKTTLLIFRMITAIFSSFMMLLIFDTFYTSPQKSGGLLCYTLQTVLSVCSSIHPSVCLSETPRPTYKKSHIDSFVRTSVSASFPDSNYSSFWSIFFKLCMDIDIGEEWFGIANGLNSFINNRVMALDLCKNVFFLNIFRTNGWDLIKFCICIDIYKNHVVSNAHWFWSIFNRVMALDRRQNFVYAQYLVDFVQTLYMHWYWQDVDFEQYFSFIFNRVMALD